MSDVQTRLNTAVDLLETDSNLLNTYVHGDNTATITTNSGTVSSIAKLEKDVQDTVTSEIAAVTTAKDAAETARDEAVAAVGGVKVSANDTTAGTLDSKVAVSGGGTISFTDEGENETLVINLPDKSSQPQAVAGTDDNSYMTPLKTKQAIESLASTDNASTATKGVVQKATVAQIKAETATGSTGAELFVTPEDMVYHHGVAKAWGSFNGSGTVALQDGFNASSISDLAVGRYAVNTSVTFANNAFSFQAINNNINDFGGSTVLDRLNPKTTSSVTFYSADGNSGNPQDSTVIDFAIHGELA